MQINFSNKVRIIWKQGKYKDTKMKISKDCKNIHPVKMHEKHQACQCQ